MVKKQQGIVGADIPYVDGIHKRKSRKQFSRIYISLQCAIHVTIGFPIIFSETNFVKVRKIHKIHEICSPQKKEPYDTNNISCNMHLVTL